MATEERTKKQTMHRAKSSNCKDSQAVEQQGLQPITVGAFWSVGWLKKQLQNYQLGAVLV